MKTQRAQNSNAGSVTPGRPRLYLTTAAKQAAYRRRKNTPAIFRHQSDEWSTPQQLFDELNKEFQFGLDVAATAENAKCAVYYAIEQDGLKQPWVGVCWMNPPYGSAAKGSQTQKAKNFGRWIQKAHESAAAGATVVALLPSRTDTHWWHDHVIPYAEIRYIRGRLKFERHGSIHSSATHPSVVAIFRPKSPER